MTKQKAMLIAIDKASEVYGNLSWKLLAIEWRPCYIKVLILSGSLYVVIKFNHLGKDVEIDSTLFA